MRARPFSRQPQRRRWRRAAVVAAAVVLAGATGWSSAPAASASPLNHPPSTALYVDPGSQATAWVNSHGSDRRAGAIRSRIATVPTARWFVNGSDAQWADAYVDRAQAAGRTPFLVAYYFPQRDCGSYSSGGAPNASAYLNWITQFSRGIGNRKAIVLLEPDSLYYIDCLDAQGLAARQSLLRQSIGVIGRYAPNTTVYLDGGTPVHGTSGAQMAARLAPAGIGLVRGFAVNINNFRTDADSEAFATEIARSLSSRGYPGKRFVIDSSRNGHGSNGQWCNPAGRKVGRTPSWSTSAAGRDGYVWIKTPGESDGACGTAGSSYSGQFVPDLAYALATG